MPVISVRIDEAIENDIKFLMQNSQTVDKFSVVRNLLVKALQQEIIEVLCNSIATYTISIGKAAQTANITLRQMLDELATRNIPMYDEVAFQQDLDFLEKHYDFTR